MKRLESLTEQVADPDNIRLASWKAAKGKRLTPAVLAWFSDMDTQVARLREQVLEGDVAVGQYHYFKVYEPKERQICASAFAEQVLHHALMNVCHECFERAQIFDSYASRKNKGTYAALERAKTYTRRHEWFLKLDVQKFFETVHHTTLNDQLARLFKDRRLLRVFEQIVGSFEAQPGRGLPIGNLTSQYFANHFLSGLDHFILEKLRRMPYVRYMDDMVLWHDEPSFLKNALAEIIQYIENQLFVELKPPLLRRCASGLPFLGYHLFPHKIHLLQKSKQRFLKKMRRVHEHWHDGSWPESKCQRHALPLLAFAHWANAKKLRENLLLRLEGQSP